MKEKVIVLKEFADKNNISRKYKVGDELKDFSKERIANLVQRGLAEIQGKNDDVTGIDLSAHYKTVISQVEKFEDVEKLQQYLEIEKASEKPRETVVKAIEERIANLVGE